jgi:hypothetical protein
MVAGDAARRPTSLKLPSGVVADGAVTVESDAMVPQATLLPLHTMLLGNMPLAERLRRLAPSTPAEYECRLCTATYDREPPNCPTCGGTDFRER